jgi:N-acyl-D-aspartate/D-glutamate deacylase
MPFTDWPRLRVAIVTNGELQPLVHRLVGDIANETRRDPFDVVLDIVVEDEGLTIFETAIEGDDDESWSLRAQIARDPRVVVGASDAGAHLDMLDTFALHTRFLAEAVRKRNLLPLVEAVRLMTSAPADLYGLRNRGRLVPGASADIVIFDASTVGPGVTCTRHDLPGGAARLYSEPTGIEHVFVNGVETVTRGQHTGRLPGAVLRSGTDTITPAMTR